MPLDDAFGGGAGDALRDQLLSQYQPDDGQPNSVDPVALNDRLARKLTLRGAAPVPSVDFSPKPEPEEKAPDLSSFGKEVEPTPEPSNDDLSSFGTEVKPPDKPLGITGQLGAFGKGVVQGVVHAGASISKGLAIANNPPLAENAMSLVDELGNSGSMSASERAKLSGRAMRSLKDRSLMMDYNAALARIGRGGDAKAEMEGVRSKFTEYANQPKQPVQERRSYKEGEDLAKFGESVAPMTDQEKASIGGQTGQVVGGTAPYVALGLVNPVMALGAGAAGMALSSAGSTFEAAKTKGATDEQAAQASKLAGAIGGALGVLPLGAVLRPISQVSPGIAGYAAAKLAQASQSGLTFATIGEAQEYLLQQVAKAYYDDKAGYSPDAKRVLASMLGGGMLGVVHPLKPADVSSPEAIADFIRRVAETPRPRAEGEPFGTERGAAWRKEMDDFMAARANQDVREGKEPVGLPKPEEPPAAAAPEPGPESPQPGPDGTSIKVDGVERPDLHPKKPAATPPTEQTEREALQRYGWSEAEINDMTPAQRRTEFQDAMATGQSEPAKSAKPAATPAATTKSDVGAFTTAKGSTYEVHEDGTTTRNKAARADVGHEGDSGPKERSAKTVYVAPDKIGAFALPQDARWRVVDHGDGTMSLSTWNEKQKNWGISPESRKIPVSTEPTEGSHPLELWKPETIKGRQAYKGMHPGNAIKVMEPRSSAADTAGKRTAPIKATTQEDVLKAQPAEPKSQAQAEAENYQHAHLELAQFGLVGKNSISIETGVGGTRKGPIGPDGKPEWEVKMEHGAYGRIKGTKGADGKELDIMVGPHPSSPHAFIIDQHDPKTGKFDEHKIYAGYRTPIDALHAYAHSYNDQGRDRIGHVTAMGPDEFQEWRKGDTTKPLKKTLSDDELGSAFDEILAGDEGKKAGPESITTPEPASLGKTADLVEDGGSQPDQPVDGTRTGGARSVEGEVISPGRLYTEPSEQHHAQIEAILGKDYDRVLPVDAARAAELLAEHEGMEPGLAFQWAVIENAVAQKFLTHEQAEQAYGPEVKDILQSEREGAPVSGSYTEQGSAASGEVRAGGAEETGIVPGGGETGGGKGSASEAVKDGEQHDTGSGQPNPRRKARGAAADETGAEHEPAAEDAADTGAVDRFEADRAALPNFKKGTKVEFTQGGDFKQPDGTTKEGRLVRGTVTGIASKQQGTVVVKEDGAGTWTIGASKLGLPTDPKNDIQDAGEKLGRARKDKWIGSGLGLDDIKGMSDDEAAKKITKHAVWERPDYVAAIEDGVEPLAAALIKRVYDRIAVHPTGDKWDDYKPDKKDREHYVMALAAAREVFGAVKTADDAMRASDKINRKLGDQSYQMLTPLRQKGSGSNPLHLSRSDKVVAEKAVAEGFPKAEPWTRYFEVTAWDDGKFVVYRKNGGRSGQIHDSKEAAIAAAKALYDGFSDERKAKGEEPKRPHLDKVERSGPDYRKGRNVVGDDFVKDFGFRGVEFGNYVASDERQKIVNLAYDALHDLARVLGVNPKAISLDGTLGVGFGSRGQGGKAAAHYESDYRVINMTKLSGAGTLAHEWGHALDDYLGRLNGGAPGTGISGWRNSPSDFTGHFSARQFLDKNGKLPLKLRSAANRLMHHLFAVEEEDAGAIERIEAQIKERRRGLQSWIDHGKSIKEKARTGGSSKGLAQVETQTRVWAGILAKLERQLADGIPRKAQPSSFWKQASALSGPSGDYWRRPNELFARSFEAFVSDKIAADGFQSQYLVHGADEGRYGAGFRGNPYPSGAERKIINADYERLLRAVEAVEGVHGPGTRLQAAHGEPEPVETSTIVKKPVPHPSPVEEIKAVDEASKPKTLDSAFEQHFNSGGGFEGILAARKFAKEAGFDAEPKAVEEALEFAIVKAARSIVSNKTLRPDEVYSTLVSLYGKQPRLGTRTSTSVRDQAYSTPVPLAYVASKLAGITKQTTVYEPTAGNGALLIAADPRKVYANELNPERVKNLRAQDIFTGQNDAAALVDKVGPYDVVIANPPFGAIKEGGESKRFDLSEIQHGYQTNEIDHVIALRSLKAMADNGRAVLILGGVNKQTTSREGRSDAYNGKAKREFFLTLYKNYNVTDHFTVNGDLYERQGAGWPVDVIVINGRGQSTRALPAVDVPRIYDTWASLGGLLDEQPNAGSVAQAGGANERPAGERSGVGGSGNRGGAGAGGGQSVGQSQPQEPAGVREQPVSGQSGAAGGKRVGTGNEPGEPGRQPAGSGDHAPAERPSSGLTDAEIGDAFDSILAGEKAKDQRTTPEVAKSAAKNVVDAADEAMQGLTDLFGGGKTLGMGINFDEKTYQKAKPQFRAAAEKFADFKHDIRELMRRMIEHLKSAYKWTNETLERAKPYIVQFMKDVQSGEINLHKPVEQTKAKPESKKANVEGTAEETEHQVTYLPQSKTQSLDTLVPVNMKKSTADSLQHLEDRVGPIDDFVGNELGYPKDADGEWNKNEKGEPYFGAEQVDALGLAIDNIKRGKGFIIGDQTGIGKGRVNAAIIRWAIQNKRTPVFVTMIPQLYADMYRDMKDIGALEMFKDGVPRILATNSDANIPLEEGGSATIKTRGAKEHGQHMASLVADGAFAAKYDMVFTTYAQMQTLKGEDTARRQFLSAIVPNSVMIFDESHNAGGQKTQRKEAGPAGRSDFARDLVMRANGVFYSSATYAKRPDVMDLYSATDMAMAVDNIGDLADAIQRGGVPMQQAVAAMLSKAGQYIRRERSFAGIEYNTPTVPVHRENYDKISRSLSAIQNLSKLVSKAADAIDEELKGSGQIVGADGSTGNAGASSTNFTAIMHNVINQMLLSMKVQAAADRAIAIIQRGEKPVLTVANTMESFLKDYSGIMELEAGAEMNGDFADVLQKYVERTRTITIRKPFMKKGEKAEKHYLTDAELGPLGLDAYHNAKDAIGQMDLSDLPLSPIDYLKGQLKKAGYSVGEITGRKLTVDYAGETPVLSSRPGSELTTRGRNATLASFNKKPENGGIHALILNQAGSTGISAHASAKFNDQSPRRMLIVQPEGNIDTHMQLLGRINRTGQVALPAYDQLVADIPAEKRPAAVLAKKMASLNANTTASRSSAVTAKDVPDFINEYGDAVAAAYLRDNLEMNPKLAFPVKMKESGDFDKEDAMRKLTGRIPLLPLAEQEEVYQHLEDEYKALMEQLEASGENALEAKTYDLKAKTLETTEVQGQRNNSGSPFAAPVNVEKVSVARLGKPLKPWELVSKVFEKLGLPNNEVSEHADEKTLSTRLQEVGDPYTKLGKRAADQEQTERDTMVKAFDAYTRPLLDDIGDKEEHAKQFTKFNFVKDRWTQMHEIMKIGTRVSLRTANGNLRGVVIDIVQKGTPKNPLALSTWKATFAIADASRQMVIPFSRLYPEGRSDPESSLDIEVVPKQHWTESAKQTLEYFQHGQSEAREERYIATGNLLAAYDWLDRKGAIINYTDDKGHTRQGIITAKAFELGKHAIAKGKVVSDPMEIKDWLDRNVGTALFTKDGVVSLRRADRWSGDYVVQTEKSKKTGGKYFLDKDLTAITGDFSSRGGKMTAEVGAFKFAAAVSKLQELGAIFTMPTAAPKATKVPEEPGSGGEALANLSTTMTERGREYAPQLQKLIGQMIDHVIGPGFSVEFHNEEFNVNVKGYGDIERDVARGLYSQDQRLIKLAMIGGAAEIQQSAFHEAYHGIEDRLQTPQERDLMQRETPRMREAIKGKTALSDAEIDGLAGYEVRAIAFQKYAYDRANGTKTGAGRGEHIGIRRWFEKMWQLLRQLGNGLRGLGFKTYEDIFAKAYKGEFAGRAHGEKGIDADSLAAFSNIFRRRQNGTVSNRIRDLMGTTTRANRFVENYQNLSEGVKRLESAVEARMEGELPDSKAFYTKKRLFPGKVATEVQDFNKAHLDPLVDWLKTKDVTLDQVGDIVYAQHAPERNAYIEGINPGLGDAGSGMSNAEAARILNLYPADLVIEIAHRIDGIRDFILDTMVSHGLESRARVDAWKEQYQHYAPLGGFEEPRDDLDDGFRESGKFNVRGREVKQAFGRSSKADNPLVNLIDQAYLTIERGKKNEYLRSLYSSLRGLDFDDLKGFVMFDRGKPRQEIDPNTGLVRTVDDNSYRFSPNAVALKIGGNTHYMVFDKREMAETLKRMYAEGLGWLQPLLNIQNKIKATWTHYSPEFLIRHFIFRYPVEGTLNSFEQGAGEVPSYMKNSIPILGRSTRAIFASNRGQRHADPDIAQLQDYWEEMRKHGGAQAFRQSRDVDLLREHLKRKLDSLSRSKLSSVRDKLRAATEAIDVMTNAMDNSLRLSAYATARRQGKSEEQAALIARDATIDYQLAGRLKNWMGLWFPFANVAAQTGARMGAAVSRSKMMRRVFGATIIAGFLSGMFNYLVGGDDTDGVPFADKMAWWEKSLAFTVLNPYDTDAKGRPQPIHIPMPYNWAFPLMIGQAFAAMAFTKDKHGRGKAMHALMHSAVEAFTPAGGEQNMAALLAPEMTRPLVHSYTNENWNAVPVHKDPAFQKGPNSESGRKTTGQGWKWAAASVNSVSGGDRHHSGHLDFYPEDLRNVLSYYTGSETLMRFGRNAAETATNASEGKPLNQSHIPLLRVVRGTDYDAADKSRMFERQREQKHPWMR